MSALTLEIDQTLRGLDKVTVIRLERLVRDALELVRPITAEPPAQPQREEWLRRLDQLRASVGTGKQGPVTEEMLDDLRSERCQ